MFSKYVFIWFLSLELVLQFCKYIQLHMIFARYVIYPDLTMPSLFSSFVFTSLSLSSKWRVTRDFVGSWKTFDMFVNITPIWNAQLYVLSWLFSKKKYNPFPIWGERDTTKVFQFSCAKCPTKLVFGGVIDFHSALFLYCIHVWMQSAVHTPPFCYRESFPEHWHPHRQP